MSAGKRRSVEDTFHIQYPARRDFLSWGELGCLARALGFPPDLIRDQVNEEVVTEEDGLTQLQLRRMIELKLLHQPLHRSFNMHTADWNLCVIRKAITLLHLSVLSFEELHNIRVAYATYEASDMKGLHLDQRTLLRTLKMCHRIISPKKLMHRVKHMKSRLEETNRIQLYEFFDLILWCDYMESDLPVDEAGQVAGKERDLYTLVDFGTLLSHQDQRLSRALDERYLAEEWDFGRERLGNKHMFKGEVVHTDQRVKLTYAQKRKYRHLKKVVNQSQRQVYRAHAGSIRARPISAPNLSMYATPRETPNERTTSAAAVYQSVQRRLHSAPSRASKLDISDRPTIPEYVRVHTPCVVTSDDLDDVTIKMQNLEFDIITLESRCQVKLEDERNFYIPDYKPPLKDESSDGAVQSADRMQEHWTPEIIENLAYPPFHLPSHHAHTCDARFRGWKPASHRGKHRILTVHTFDSSPHGQLLAKQRAAMLAPVAAMHKDYVIRHTSKEEAHEQQREQRPCTAPAMSPRPKPVQRIGSRSAAVKPGTCPAQSLHAPCGQGQKGEEDREDPADAVTAEHDQSLAKPPAEPARSDSKEVSESDAAEKMKKTETAEAQGHWEKCPSAARAGHVSRHESSASSPSKATADSPGKQRQLEDLYLSSAAVPSVRNNRSKVVEVGLMGTIKLLESIQEQDMEERLSETSTFSSSSSPWPSQGRHLATGYSAGQHEPSLDHDHRQLPNEQATSAKGKRGTSRAHVANNMEDVLDNGAPASGKAGQTDPRAEKLVSSRKGVASTTAGVGEAGEGAVQRCARYQTPAFPRSAETHDQRSGQDLGTSPKVIVEFPTETKSKKPEPSQEAGSTTDSTASEESGDPRAARTPLTSVTVTIRNKEQPVVSSTRVNDDVDVESEVTDGSGLSPRGFPRSAPCVTSTPRRRRSSPEKGSGSAGKRRAKSSGRERSGSAVSPPNSATLESRENWIQDQILAMNSAFHGGEKERGEADVSHETVREADGDVATCVQSVHRKKSIQFSEDVKDAKESASEVKLRERALLEGLLRPKNFDLDAETPRRFTFNKATTRRLLQRVHDVISPELRSRIRTGDMGMKVSS